MRVVLHSPCLEEKDDGDGFQCSMLFPANNQMKVRVTRSLVQQWDSQRSKTPKGKVKATGSASWNAGGQIEVLALWLVEKTDTARGKH